MDPVVLPANQPADRFYLGGPQISAFRGVEAGGPRTPEDWVASTTTVRGHASLGLTRLPGGSLLVDEIDRHPLDWLGPQHLRVFGPDPKLLVKLLDAGQRLPVHAHPSAAFAGRHLGAAHGKAEAWYLLTPGEVYLGLREGVPVGELAELVAGQQVETMLGLMHRVPVQPGDTVYVPPGVLHAIGASILLAEVQEPEDLSILLEWRDFALDGLADGHLGLGFDTALQAVETQGRSAAEIDRLILRDGADGVDGVDGQVLVEESRPYFRLERVRVGAHDARCAPGFAVLVVIEGALELVPDAGARLPVARGGTVVIPHAAGPFTLTGRGTALLARPPAAS